jgi:hypothetical protein
VLAGFTAPTRAAYPRVTVDTIIVPWSQADGLADDIARLWPVKDRWTALDLAIVAALAGPDADRHLWDAPRQWRTESPEALIAPFCSFWWD